MALTSGARLGPYEIEAAIGAGGMGEVYRARDTRLERTVAVKVLNAQLVADSELRGRFEREAKIISQLQHPNICVLHDVGHEGTIDYLVMEFLQGESLAERLRKGPLVSEEILRIAIEIADALEKAHRAGIVHRDLKPGNVMLTKSGAKLLDFGLAKPLGVGPAHGGRGSGSSVLAGALTQTSPAASPTTPLSTAGAVLGTVQYMSPEQIQGIEADARSDIFSFGAMLFEMATGKRTFEGKTQASIVGQILAVDPPSVSLLRPETPPGLDRVIRLCLDKDPDERIQTSHDLKLQLQAIAETPLTTTQAPAVAPARRAWLPWAAAAALGIAAIALALAYLQSLRTPQVSVHSYILPPEKTTFLLIGPAAGPPMLSPDGLRVAFIAKNNEDGKQMLWLRPLNSSVAQPMSGTDGASFPFWSADSRYVGFFTAGKLNKVNASGGPPQALCDAPSGRGGSWSNTGTIVFTPDSTSALWRVDAAGGTRVALTTLDSKETSHRWPAFLPDGNHFLYFARGSTGPDNGIYVAALDSKERKLLLRNDSNAIYAAPGFLLFVRDNTLMEQRFNPRSLALEDEAKPVADHVAVNTDTYRSIVTASANGELVYQHGTAGGASKLIWYDASGKQGEPVLPESADYFQPTLSPDGSKLAFVLETNGVGDIWVVDLARHTKTRLTFGPQYSGNPVWWPDGKSIVFCYGSSSAGDSLYRQNADGTGRKEKLLENPGIRAIASSISLDARYIAYMRYDPKSNTNTDIWALPIFPDKSGERKPLPVVVTNFRDITPSFSPDGKWIAYANDETGRFEVYIQPFSGGAGRWQVSTAGGFRPNWRKDGKELFYFTIDQQVMAVDVRQIGASLQLGTPHTLFKATTVSGPTGPYTVSADGKRFVMNTILPQSVTEPLTLITHWTADLKQ